jgi:hypothetical protein
VRSEKVHDGYCLLTTQERPGLGLWFTRKEEVAEFMNKREFRLLFYIISVQNDADLRKSEKKNLLTLTVLNVKWSGKKTTCADVIRRLEESVIWPP